MKGERRDHWLRLCVEAADEQDSNRFLEMIAEINHLLHEKQMRLTNVRREAGGYVIEAADEKARSSRRSISILWNRIKSGADLALAVCSATI
jgi:hypothetical protein